MEFVCKFPCSARKKLNISPNQGKRCSRSDIFLGLFEVEGIDAYLLSGSTDNLKCVIDGLEYIRMGLLTQKPHRGRQV